VVACGEKDNLKIEDTLYDLNAEETFRKIEDTETLQSIVSHIKLTDKEKNVLQQWIGGKKQKEIANDLGQTQANVSRIMKKIFKKMREGEK